MHAYKVNKIARTLVILSMPLPVQSGTLTESSGSAAAPPLPYADTLLGNWGGLRDQMAEHGLTVDLSFTGFYLGLISGDGCDDREFGSRADAFLHLVPATIMGAVLTYKAATFYKAAPFS